MTFFSLKKKIFSFFISDSETTKLLFKKKEEENLSKPKIINKK